MANNPTPITALLAGASVKGTDVYPAVDVTDLTQSPNGSTYKYTVNQLSNYVVSQLGLSIYPPVQAATTTALATVYNNGAAGIGATLISLLPGGPLTVDGVVLTANQFVLVKDQLLPQENGIYIVSNPGSPLLPYILTRAGNFDSPSTIVDNGTVLVLQGTVNENTYWKVDFVPPATVGVTALIFSLLTFGNAAFKDVTDNAQPDVVSMVGAAIVNHLPIFADIAGSITDSGIAIGTAAGKAVSDNGQALVASVDGPIVNGTLAMFTDNVGTITSVAGGPGDFLLKTNNLSDVASAAASRVNLDVPQTTGAGATGLWPIDITGNANTVTTNANLVGDVTSVGNTTTYNNIVPTMTGGTGLSTAGTAGNVLTSDGVNWVSNPPALNNYQLVFLLGGM